ncbi:8394_t:CDS:10, partial [Diversispora eburnea]
VSILFTIVASFNPGVRCFHEMVHIGDKLFFLGGYNNNHLKDFFYLDLSISFHKDIPPWYNLDFREIPIGVSKAAASFGGFDGATIFLMGGERSDSGSHYIYMFNTKSFTWEGFSSDISIIGRFWDTKGVTNDKGRIYFYGGLSSGCNRLQILDPLNSSKMDHYTWPKSPLRYGHSVTLLSNGVIVIIGGHILFYDTYKNTMGYLVAQGISLSERERHTAVLTNDGRIIVYGKFKMINDEDYSRHTYLMDVRNYTWVAYFHPERNVVTITQGCKSPGPPGLRTGWIRPGPVRLVLGPVQELVFIFKISHSFKTKPFNWGLYQIDRNSARMIWAARPSPDSQDGHYEHYLLELLSSLEDMLMLKVGLIRIIVYGGIKNDSFDHDLVVLDANFQPFKWSMQFNNHPPLYGLYGHSANIVGDYMIF